MPQSKQLFGNLGYYICANARLITNFFNARLKQFGLNMNQFLLMEAIAFEERDTITSLAEDLCCDRTTLTRNLQLIARRGLASKQLSVNKRCKRVTLTKSGMELWSNAHPVWMEAKKELQDLHGEEQCENLSKHLVALAETLQDN